MSFAKICRIAAALGTIGLASVLMSGCGGGDATPVTNASQSQSTHTVEWLIAHIRNPKSHKPESRMPAFDGKISQEDLKALAEYLASLQ